MQGLVRARSARDEVTRTEWANNNTATIFELAVHAPDMMIIIQMSRLINKQDIC